MDIAQVRLDLEGRVQQAYLDMADTVSKEFQAEGINFDLRSTLSQETRQLIGERATFAADKALRDIYREVIVDATDGGWTVPATAAAIVERVDSMAGYRATALARTDLVGVANSSSYLSALRTFEGRDDVRKQWLATNDDLTRETHVEANGQQRPLREPFRVGFSALRYPGDPWGAPEEVFNCRCTIVYTVSRPGGPLDDVRPSSSLMRSATENWSDEQVQALAFDDLVKINPDYPTGSLDAGSYEERQVRKATISQWREKIEARMRQEMNSDAVRVAVRADVFTAEKIIEDGRFKSQHETNSSRGMLSPGTRRIAELDMFSYPNDLPAEERPIYGYLDGLTQEYGAVSSYGEVKFVMKPEVKERTTFTSTDSLNSNLVPAAVTAPRITALYRRSFGDKLTGLDFPVADWGTVYWEAQIHRSVSLHDVEKIIVFYTRYDFEKDGDAALEGRKGRANEIANTIRTALRRVGIESLPVTIEPDRSPGALGESAAEEIEEALGHVGSGAGLADDLGLVDGARDVPPVASGEDGLDGKLAVQDVVDAVVDATDGVGAAGLSADEDQEQILASNGDGFHTPQYDRSRPRGRVPSGPMSDVEEASMTELSGQTAAVVVTITDDEAQETGERVPWQGILAIAGKPTSDRRYLIPGEIGERELPLPLAPSHEAQHESDTVGRIESIQHIPASEFDKEDWELPEDLPPQAVVIWGEGTFDGSPAAQDARRALENGVGVSLDLPMEREALIDATTYEEVDPLTLEGDQLAAMMFGKIPEGYLHGIGGKIGGLSLASIAAFEETTIRISGDSALVASGYAIQRDHERAFAQTLVASMSGPVSVEAPIAAPRDWFFMEEPDEPTPMTIRPDGRVFFHLALWNTCHAGRTDGAFSSCMFAPHSPSNYKQFHLGSHLCDDGSEVPIGRLTIGTGHAPLHLNAAAARRHYDHSGTCVAFGRMKDGIFGPFFTGVIKNDATPEQIRDLRACPPSGDWRSVDHMLELQAALAVNTPGYPVPRSQLSLAASADSLELQTLILAAPEPDDFREALRAEYGLVDDENIELLLDLDLDEFEIELASLGHVDFKTYSAEQRREMAKDGRALPDGSFPIGDCLDAENAIRAQARGTASQRRVVSHIRMRVGTLGCSGDLFDPYK